MKTETTLLAVVAASLSISALVSAQEATWSGSLQYSTGEYYFTEPTRWRWRRESCGSPRAFR